MSIAFPKTSAPPAAPAPGADACPRCAKPLVDPAGLGWCQACGFCKSLEDDKARIPLQATGASAGPKPAGAMSAVIGNLPVWFWILLGGMALFAGATLLPAYYFGKNPLHRALWCTGQILAGLLFILAAQFLALLRMAPEDEKLSIKDVFLPFRLWGLAFGRMPALRVPVWLAGWGLALIAAALIFVGGLSHWLTYLPKSGNQKGPQATTSRPAR